MNQLSSFAASTTLTAIKVDRLSIEKLVVDMLDRCATGDSLCPSDVARAAAQEEWRTAMPAVRTAACRLAVRDIIRIVPQGTTLPFDGHWRGPIRLVRGRAWDSARCTTVHGADKRSAA